MPHDTNGTERPRPPYIPASTFLTTIDGWRAVRPSRVDRSVLSKVAGSMQTWLIAALKYFDLIDAAGVPTPKLDALATATDDQRRKIIAELLHEGYPFIFTKGVDLTNITHADLRQKFIDTGAQGETAVKAMSFFTAMAKAANLTVSPYVLTRQRRNGKRTAKPKPPAKPDAPHPPPPEPPRHHTPQPPSVTPMQVLIEMLDIQDMDDPEQAAVWTLIRYLKKKGGS